MNMMKLYEKWKTITCKIEAKTFLIIIHQLMTNFKTMKVITGDKEFFKGY